MSDRAEQAQRLYALAGSGDWEAAEAMLTDDFVASEASTLPFAGTYPGKGGLRALFEKAMGMMDLADMTVRDIMTSTDAAVAHVEFTFTDGTRAELMELFRFRGDQVCEIKPFYFDTTPVTAAAAAKRSAR